MMKGPFYRLLVALDFVRYRLYQFLGRYVSLRETPWGPTERYLREVRQRAFLIVKIKPELYPELKICEPADEYWYVNAENDLLVHANSNRTIDFYPFQIDRDKISSGYLPRSVVEDHLDDHGLPKPDYHPAWLQQADR